MSSTSATLLRSGSNLIPQGFDVAADAYKAISVREVSTGEWAQNVINWGLTAGGVYVPLRVNSNGNPMVTLAGSTSVLAGASTAVTTTAVALSTASVSCNWVTAQNDPDNTDDILVGSSSSQTMQLVPGQGYTFPSLTDVSMIYVKTASSTFAHTVNWIAG